MTQPTYFGGTPTSSTGYSSAPPAQPSYQPSPYTRGGAPQPYQPSPPGAYTTPTPSVPQPQAYYPGDEEGRSWLMQQPWFQTLMGWVLGPESYVVPILKSNPDIINEDGGVNWGQYAASTAKDLALGATYYEDVDPATGQKIPRVGGGSFLDVNDYITTYDASIHATNTVVGGAASVGYGALSAGAAGDWSKSSSPQMRDGYISPDEAWQIFNPLENDTTIGQQVTTGSIRTIQNAFFTATGIIGGEDTEVAYQKALDQWILDSQMQSAGQPGVLDKLGSWQLVFDYNFDQFDEWQRKTAFETMGPPKFLSGGLDFTWQALAAPEVLLAKGFSAAKAANIAFKFSTAEGRAVARTELTQHNIYRMSGGTAGKVTDVGLLAESLARMSPRQVMKHDIAVRSNNPSLVANVLGQLKDPRDVGDAMLALAGDTRAASSLATKFPSVADKIKFAQEDVQRLRGIIDDSERLLDDFEEGGTKVAGVDELGQPVGTSWGGALPALAEANLAWARTRAPAKAAAVRNEIELNAGEVKMLQATLEDAYRQVPGLRAAAQLDAKVLNDVGITVNVGYMEARALKRAGRQSGAFSEFVFKIPGGRPVRVIRSAWNKLGTNRATGQVKLTDDREFIAEIDSVLNNNHAYRKAVLAPEGSEDRMINIFSVKTNEAGRLVEHVERVDAIQYRARMMNEALSLTPGKGGKSLAVQRAEFSQRLEREIFFDLLDRYGVSRTRALEVFENFKYMRNTLAQQIKDRGWVKDNGEIVVVPDLQSQIDEIYMMLDFDMIESILRLQVRGTASKATAGARRGFNEIARVYDMFWRPLALMRLGYTQRNVAEGWIRTLASYGSIASLSDVGTGGKNFWVNTAYRASAARNSMRPRNWRKGSVRRARENLANDAGYLSERERLARAYDEEIAGYDRTIERMRSKIEARIWGEEREGLGPERSAARAGESAVWDDVMGDVSARIGEDWLDYADDLWINPEDVRAFGGLGFEELPSAILNASQRTSGATSMLPMQWGDNLTEKQFSRLHRLITQDESGAATLVKPSTKNFESFKRLWVKDLVARAKQEIDEGNALVAYNKDGTYSRVRDIKTTLEDAAAGWRMNPDGSLTYSEDYLDSLSALVTVPKGTQVKAVRSTVYGGTLDLRIPESNPAIDLWRTANADALGVAGEKVSRSGGELSSGEIIPAIRSNSLEEMSFTTSGSITEDFTALNNFYRAVFGESMSRGQAQYGQDFDPVIRNFIEPSQMSRLDDLIAYMEADPEFAQAVFTKIWADSLPADVRRVLDEKGLIIKSEQINKYLASQRGGLVRQENIEREFNIQKSTRIRALIQDDARWMAAAGVEGSVYSGAKRVPGDILKPDPPLTDTNMMNWVGPGFYTTENGAIAGEYLTGKQLFETIGGEGTLGDRVLGRRTPAQYDGEIAAYAVEPPVPERFFDMETSFYSDYLDNADEFIPPNVQAQINLQEDMIQTMFEKMGVPRSEINYHYSEFLDQAWRGYEANLSFNPDYGSFNWIDAQQSFASYADQIGISRDKFWNSWIDTMREFDFDGLRHLGGQNIPNSQPHQVYVWYKAPRITRLDEISDEALVLLDNERRLKELAWKLSRNRLDQERLDDIGGQTTFGSPVIYHGNELPGAVPGAIDWVGVERIAQVAAELGKGKVLVPARGSLEGYATVYLRDMASSNGGTVSAIDRAIPDYIHQSLVEQVDATGQAVARPVLNLADDATDIPPGPYASIYEKARIPSAQGVKRFTPEEKARMIQLLEESGSTHLSVKMEGGGYKYITKSQLLGSRRVADEYLQMTRGDEIAATVEQALAKDNAYLSVQRKRTDAMAQRREAWADISRTRARMMKQSREIAERTKKKPKKRLGQGYQTYRGVTYEDAFHDDFQGSYHMSQASSAATNARDILGYTDDMTRSMRRTYSDTSVSQSSDIYWNELEIMVNRQIRNDRVSVMMMEGKTDQEIIDWLRAGDKEAKAILRDSFPTKPGPEGRLVPDFDEGLSQRKKILDDYLPDTELRRLAAQQEVQTADLIGALGWRTLPDIDGKAWEVLNNPWQKFTTKIMHALGTVPEDVLVRHPFYRNRFNEEMRAQIDTFMSENPKATEITMQQMNNMRRASHKYALDTTRDTLYTVSRLSTPAYALRFIVPFFPAYESSMKFWTKRFVEKPVSLVRFAGLLSAPYAAGMVVDEDGNTIEPRAKWSQIPQSLFSSGKGSIIIPWFGEEKNGGNIGSFKVPLSSLNVVLPGDYPWMPTFDPLLQIPLSWVASQHPTEAEALAEFDVLGIPVGDVAVRTALPFGKPYDEKGIATVAEGSFPAALKRLYTMWQGEGSGAFMETVDDIYRTKMANWELDGRQGKGPSYEEAIEDAKTLLTFRAVSSLVLPFAATPQSPYQFYIEESRRLDEKYRGQPDASTLADQEFLSLYGTEFFRFRKSLSGSRGTGIAPTVTAMKVYEDNKQLAGRLARLGDRGELMQMLTNSFGINDEFSEMVYASQMNTVVEGAPGKFLRGGPKTGTILTGSAAEDASQIDLGWQQYEMITNMINAELDYLGKTDINQVPALAKAKADMVADLKNQNAPWARDFDKRDSGTYTDRMWAINMMLDDKQFMDKYGSAPHIVALQDYMDARQVIVNELQAREAADPDNASPSIEAASNRDLRMIWLDSLVASVGPQADPTWVAFYSRWLQNDPMMPITEPPQGMTN